MASPVLPTPAGPTRVTSRPFRKAAFDFGELTFSSNEARQRYGEGTGPGGSNNAVPEAGDSLDVPRCIGGIAQHDSDLVDRRLDHSVAHRTINPDSAQQLIFRDHPAGIQAEVLEHCEALGCYRNPLSSLPERAVDRVDPEFSEDELA